MVGFKLLDVSKLPFGAFCSLCYCFEKGVRICIATQKECKKDNCIRECYLGDGEFR